MAFARLAIDSPCLRRAWMAALGAAVVAGAWSPLHAASTGTAAPEPTGPEAAQKHWKVVETYCFKCHNTEDWAGGFAFDTMTIGAAFVVVALLGAVTCAAGASRIAVFLYC